MPLPPLPPDNTTRWYLRYSVGRFTHTLQMRTGEATTQATVAAVYNDFLTALSPSIWLASIIGLDRSAAGSNVRLPELTTGLEESYGAGVPADNILPWGVNFAGRSAGGRRAHVYFLGWKSTNDNNFIVTATESTTVAAVHTALASGTPECWRGIDGLTTTWYQRATVKQNDHIVRLLRGT